MCSKGADVLRHVLVPFPLLVTLEFAAPSLEISSVPFAVFHQGPLSFPLPSHPKVFTRCSL